MEAERQARQSGRQPCYVTFVGMYGQAEAVHNIFPSVLYKCH